MGYRQLNRCRRVFVCLAPLPLSAGTWEANAGEVTPRPQAACVLLDNGAVVRGGVHRSAGRVLISEEGRELDVAAERVRHVGRSLVDLYEQQQAAAAAGIEERLRLAGWCVRHQLWPQAAEQILAARWVSPRDPRVQDLERRLAAEYGQAQRTAAAQPAPGRNTTGAARRRQQEGAARAARQLKLVEKLPPGALEEFTRGVQPIVVHGCTNAGCHRVGGEQAFQLNRAWLHDTADRRSTLANLATVLAAIDRDTPDRSPLLVKATTAHGGLDEAPLAGQRADLVQRLGEWTQRVASETPRRAGRRPRRRLGPVAMPTYGGLIGGGFRTGPPVERGQSFDASAAGPGRASLGQQAPPGAGAVATTAALLPRGNASPLGPTRPVGPRPTQQPPTAASPPPGAGPAPPQPAEADTHTPPFRDEFDPDRFHQRLTRQPHTGAGG